MPIKSVGQGFRACFSDIPPISLCVLFGFHALAFRMVCPEAALKPDRPLCDNNTQGREETSTELKSVALPDDSESDSSKRRLVVNELGNFCEKLSRGLESALEGDDGAEVERLAQEVRGCVGSCVSLLV